MAYIKALSYFLPEKVVNNDDLQRLFPETDVTKISKSVGVSLRHIADGQTAGDMAVEAAKSMFKEYSVSPQDIDFIIFATQSQDYFLPSTACIIQNRLGIPTSAGAFDFDLGCSGYVYGLAMANSFVDSGLAGSVLLLTGDTMTHYMHPSDTNRILFGEGATATLISKTGFAQIAKSTYGTDGSGAEGLIMKTGASRNRQATGKETLDLEGNICRDDYFYMNGAKVFDFTLERVPQIIKDTLSINRISHEDVNKYIFHQANKFMLNTIRKICKIEKEKFYVNIENTGNTTSSSIPIAIKNAISSDGIKAGDLVMVAGFGVGLSWAGSILKF